MGLDNNRQLLFDEVRSCYVKATPEEQVRQRWLKLMIYELGYPKELLVVEKKITELPHIVAKRGYNRRVDILCYAKGLHLNYSLYPLLLIECKDEILTDKAVQQVIGYNYHIKACFAAALNLEEIRLGYFDPKFKRYTFKNFLPSYMELIQWAKSYQMN